MPGSGQKCWFYEFLVFFQWFEVCSFYGYDFIYVLFYDLIYGSISDYDFTYVFLWLALCYFIHFCLIMFNVFYLLEAVSFCVSAHQTGTETMVHSKWWYSFVIVALLPNSWENYGTLTREISSQSSGPSKRCLYIASLVVTPESLVSHHRFVQTDAPRRSEYLSRPLAPLIPEMRIATDGHLRPTRTRGGRGRWDPGRSL